jgi:seryl-tRNA synthetase
MDAPMSMPVGERSVSHWIEMDLFYWGQRDRRMLAKLRTMAVPERQSVTPAAFKKLERLSDQLDTASDASETTTKELQHARRTAKNVTRDLHLQQRSDDTTSKRKRSKDHSTEDGRSKAAVELGRKGGAARAKTLTRRQRSTLARKAARTRWNKR